MKEYIKIFFSNSASIHVSHAPFLTEVLSEYGILLEMSGYATKGCVSCNFRS